MVDVYHLFKLGEASYKIIRASKGAYNAGIIFKSIWKPMTAMGVCGFIDGACEDAADKIIKTLEENKNGCSR